jgi:hypothetical protein
MDALCQDVLSGFKQSKHRWVTLALNKLAQDSPSYAKSAGRTPFKKGSGFIGQKAK